MCASYALCHGLDVVRQAVRFAFGEVCSFERLQSANLLISIFFGDKDYRETNAILGHISELATELQLKRLINESSARIRSRDIVVPTRRHYRSISARKRCKQAMVLEAHRNSQKRVTLEKN